MNISEFADMVKRRRLDKGWSVEEAARRAGINRVTFKRIESALPVQDVKRRAVETLFGMAAYTPLGNGVGTDVAAIVAPDLNPDLADFTDQELLREVEQRLLLLAGKLQEAGADLLTVTTDQDGERMIVSHATKRP